jgi:hypothetical protein
MPENISERHNNLGYWLWENEIAHAFTSTNFSAESTHNSPESTLGGSV